MLRKIKSKSFLMMALGCALWVPSRAQLSGTKNIPGDYPDLAGAVTALNTQGVGTGGVVINLLTGNAQTAPAGGYMLGSTVLNASVGTGKTITINGNGNTVTAYTGTGTTDAVFSILGTDYVTINSLNLSESAANATNTTRMEWGYNLVKLNAAAPFDGCQNDVIQNCTISLNAANTVTCGIRAAHSIAGSAAILPFTGAASGDANSNNRFAGNTISNTDTAICLRGIAVSGLYDYNNTIGGTSLTQGNTITVGGSSLTNVAGIYTCFDSVLTVQYNQFGISSGQTASSIRVAMMSTGVGRGNLIIRNNRFDVSWALPPASAFTGNVYGVLNDNLIGNAYPTTGHSDITAKFVFANNYVTGTDTFATSGNFYGLYQNYTDWNIDSIYGNTFTDMYWSSQNKASAGNLRCIYESGSNTSAGTHTYQTIQNNIFYNLNKYGTPGTPELTAVDISSNQANTGLFLCTNNQVQKCYSNGSFKGIYIGNGISVNNYKPTGQIVISKYNKVNGIVANSNSGTSGNLWANYIANGTKGSEIAFDTVINCRSAAGSINAIYKTGAADVHNCYVANDTSATGYVNGIAHPAGFNDNIYSNIINNLTVTGSATFNSGIYGINASGGVGYCNIYNNSISDYNTSSLACNNTVFGISVSTVNYTASFGVYYNTIKISANSSANNFGVAGIFIGDKVIGVDLRNNIVNLTSNPKGPGIVAAVVKNSSTNGSLPPTILANTSGNNIYNVPAAGYCYYYAEGNNIGALNAYGPLNDPNFNSTCQSTYKAWMATREQTSYAENNLSPLTGNPGLYVPTGNTYAKSNCSPVSGVSITSDLLGTARPVLADIGALQFTGNFKDYFPPVISYAPIAATTVCANVAPVLNATIYDASGVNTTTAAPRMYYRKSSENDAFGTTNTSAFNGWKYVTGTNVSGNNFTFTPDYTLLTAAPAGGDSIVYFIVAQDIAGTPNTSANSVAFANGFCLTGVNLPSAAGPTKPSFVKNYYTIVTPGSPVLSPASAAFCSGSVMITATGVSTVPTNAVLGTDSTFTLNNDDNSPLDGQMYNHRQQMIFKASELSAQGMTAGVKISSVSLNVAVNYGVTFIDSLNIAMGQTTGNGYSAANPAGWFPVTKVFNGAVNVTNGINTYILNTPFTWDGTSNLVIDMVSRKNALLWSVGVFNTSRTDTLNMYYNDFGPAAAPMPYDSIIARSAANGATAITNIRPNVLLNYGAPKPKNWVPVTGLFKNAALTVPVAANDTNSVVYAAPTVSTSYSVVSVLPGCNSAPSAPSVITPVVGFAHVTPSGSVAACDSIVLHAPSASNVAYQWQKNGVSITGATDSVYHTATSGNYRVYIVAAGCSDTAAAATVTVNASPVAVITAAHSIACDSLSLTANTAAGISYQWQKNGVNIPGATGSVYVVTSGGNYSVYEHTAAGCSDTSAAVTDTINASSVPVLNVNGTILSTTAVFNSYQWNKNGQPVNGATNSTYLVTGSGHYSVTVTNAAGCSGTSADTVIIPASVAHVAQKNHASVYPNPAHDLLYVRDAGDNVTITVRDLLGKIVAVKENTKEIAIGNLAGGVYMVFVTDAAGNMILCDKVIKE